MMQSNTKLLLNTLRLSSGLSNRRKYEKDPKKRKKLSGGYVGIVALYFTLVMYSFSISAALSLLRLAHVIPLLCALTISLISFITTIIKVNGYLFAFKDYDMLMSLPISTKTVVASKFIYMYTKSLPWVLCISVTSLFGYIFGTGFNVLTAVEWLVLTLFVPLFPMILAAVIGTVFAKIGSLSKHKSLLQTILTFAFILLCFCSRYIIEAFFTPKKQAAAFAKLNDSVNNFSKYVFNAKFFGEAIVDRKISSALLLIGLSVLLAELFFLAVSAFYKDINSRLMSSVSGKKYRISTMKNHSVLNALVFKELRRMTGSTIYITNSMFGHLLTLMFSVAALFIDMDKLIGIVTSGAPVSKESLIPLIPFIIHFMLGMISTTCMSLSLEGKNFWIIQSLPIKKETMIHAKMLFNLYLTVPFTILGNMCLSIACKAGVATSIMSCVCGVALTILATVWGSVCNLKHLNLDWENEVEVVKQGASVLIYMFPSMIVTIIFAVIAFIISKLITVPGMFGVISLAVLLISALLYLDVRRLTKKL